MINKQLLIATFLLLLSPFSAARADLVTMFFNATTITDTTTTVGVGFNVPMNGYLTYDTSTSGLSDPARGIATYPFSVQEFGFTVNGASYKTNILDTIDITGTSSTDPDKFQARSEFASSLFTGPTMNGYLPLNYNLTFLDNTRTAFNSFSLPSSFALQDFQNLHRVQVTFRNVSNNTTISEVGANLTSLQFTAVPEAHSVVSRRFKRGHL